MLLTDTHSHLYDEAFDADRDQAIRRAREAGVSRIMLPAIDSGSHQRLFKLANSDPKMFFPMIGLHPTSVNDNMYCADELKAMDNYLENPPVEKFYAIGEVGLDLFWSKDWEKEQREALEFQIALAIKHNLPLVIHCRDAWHQMVEVLERYRQSNLRGIMHAYSADIPIYKKIRDLGDFLFGIGGVVTYKNSSLATAVHHMEPEHIVLETDSPYLTPVPHRGERNESAYVKLVCEKVAQIKKTTPEHVAAVTSANAARLFGLPVPEDQSPAKEQARGL